MFVKSPSFSGLLHRTIFLKAILRYNWCSVNCAQVKYKICFIVCIRPWNHYHNHDIVYIHHPKVTSFPLYCLSLSGSSFSWSLIIVIFHYKLYFPEFYINGILKMFTLFFFCLPSLIIFRFQHFAGMSTLYFLVQSSTHLCGSATICFSIHLLMDIWIDSSLEPLQIRLVWPFMC